MSSEDPKVGDELYMAVDESHTRSLGKITHIADGCAWIGNRSFPLIDIYRVESGLLMVRV